LQTIYCGKIIEGKLETNKMLVKTDDNSQTPDQEQQNRLIYFFNFWTA